MRTVAVIGKNFGDEGKGLVTASLCFSAKKPLVIRNNGGAQSGHTVENEKTKARFVHRQTGSGAEYGAATLWAEEFHPDLFQLSKELGEFQNAFGFDPPLFSLEETNITVIDDVILNMALETQRGESRHGSCAMGINACCERIEAGYMLTVGEVKSLSKKELAKRLTSIRSEYSMKRAKELGISSGNPYYEMLLDGNIIENFSEEACVAAEYVTTVTASPEWLNSFDLAVFETGQGLLLDKDYLPFAPHLTASETGVSGATRFLEKRGLSLDEAIYVSRSYVTRHGAGPLPFECERGELKGVKADKTNIENQWQGKIRYARHGDYESFLAALKEDIKKAKILPSLALTHLDETYGKILFTGGDVPVGALVSALSPGFKAIYASYDKQTLLPLTKKAD